MRRRVTIFSLCIIFTFLFANVNAQWKVYDASILPAVTTDGGDSLDISSVSDNSPGSMFVQEIIDDPDISGNKLLKYLHPDGKTMYRHYFDDSYADSSLTLMARISGERDAAYDRVFDLQWRNGNADSREELRIWANDSTLELEKAGVDVKLDMDLYAWHTYRIVVKGDTSFVYIDENKDPVISGVSTTTSSDKYIKIGDGSGDAIGGYLDWCILDVSGAYAPGEGSQVPSSLFVDGAKPMEPMWLIYDASILPSETDREGNHLDLTDLSQDSPGDGFVESIIDDPLIPGNKLLEYLQPNGTKMYRYSFDENYTDTSLTLVARVAGENDPSYDRPFDLQWRNANTNSRDELRIWPADSTIELEKAGVEVKVDMNLYHWHTYRIAVSGSMAYVYIDEGKEPVISGASTSSTSDLYIKIGDGSGDAIGGYLDWCIVDMSGAYAPGEGLPIPEGLKVDSPKMQPMWLVYDAGILPSETDREGNHLDLTDLSQDAPGDGFIEEIIDDPDHAGNKLLKYLQPNGTKMYRYSFEEDYTDTSLTLVARVAGENDPSYERPFDLQWRNANTNSRDELRIWPADSTIELEKAGEEVKVDMDLYQWHTYRIAVSGNTAYVYIDEGKEPVISGASTSSTSDLYIKIGDGSGDAIGGYLDWCIVDMSGAYAPGEGMPIPEGLIVDGLTAVDDFNNSLLPSDYMLSQNYPNPFNPSTTINFQIPESRHVKILVYNILGQQVANLVDKELNAGSYKVTFDASHLTSGIYFYSINAGNFREVKKMMLLK